MSSRKYVSQSGSHAKLESSSRRKKAEKIAAVLKRHNVRLENSRVLDIGTGSGDIAAHFSTFAKTVDSVDLHDERIEKKDYKFTKVSTAELPFKASSFDIVISNHVVEHIPDQATHISEALRVLKPGGTLYLATPNKHWIRDPHYRLFFISWLPRSLSTGYLKLLKGKDRVWDVYPASHWMLKKYAKSAKMNKAVPTVISLELSRIKQFASLQKTVFVKRSPTSIASIFQYFSPTLVYVVSKR